VPQWGRMAAAMEPVNILKRRLRGDRAGILLL